MVLPVLALFGFMMLQNQAPAVPAIVKDPDFPLRVQVAETGSSSSGFHKMSGYGHGNVLGPPAQGFDYTQECNQRFAPRPEGDQYFRARWKKQGQRLEILIQEMGSDKITACELKVALREEPYELNATRTGVMRLGSLPVARPAVPVTEPDANFPLRLQLWVTSSGTSSMAGSHAEGYGNVIGPPAQGFDFANECPVRLSLGRNRTDVYQARWAQQGLQLEILVQEVGTAQESVCRMDVGMKSAPYPAPAPLGRPAAPAPKTASPQAPPSDTELPPP